MKFSQSIFANSKCLKQKKRLKILSTIVYIYIYIYKHIWLNNKDKFCLYNFIKILSSFLISVLVSSWNWWMIYQICSHHFQTFHRPSSGVACMYKECFVKTFLGFFITLQNYVNAESVKTEMLMCLKNRIVMGSVLRPIFSNFYLSALENKVFDTINKTNIYWRYADDILLLTNSIDEINIIQETFQNNSVINFPQEININNKISFLCVLIDTSNIDRFTTYTYEKPTNINPCTLNFHSECPFRYKKTIIKTLISSAKLLSSFRTIVVNELKNMKQILTNNGFPNFIVETDLYWYFINKTEQHNIHNTLNHKQLINLY